jgi:eukaryotic-like serine/threonine-protein kinase
MLNPATGARRVLVEGGSDARYIPTGHLVYLRAGTLMGVRFNVQQLEAAGSPVPLVEGVFGSTDNTGAAQADFSALGSLAYVSGDRQAPDRTLTWVDRNGAEQPLPLPPRFYRHPRISPDGRRIVLDIDEGNKSDLWLYDLVRGTLTRTTFEGIGAFAIWTPDGNKVAFQNINNNAGTLGLASVNGTDAGENLTTAGNSRWPASWSPGGETLAFIEFDAGKGMDLWTLSLKEGRKVRPFLQTPFNETNPSFSRDGHWIAYQSDESGRDEI